MVMTLNDQSSKTLTELKKLRDLFEKRANQVEKAFGKEGSHLEDLRRLRSQYNALNLVIENNFDQDLQNACNSGDRYERFNLEEK